MDHLVTKKWIIPAPYKLSALTPSSKRNREDQTQSIFSRPKTSAQIQSFSSKSYLLHPDQPSSISTTKPAIFSKLNTIGPTSTSTTSTSRLLSDDIYSASDRIRKTDISGKVASASNFRLQTHSSTITSRESQTNRQTYRSDATSSSLNSDMLYTSDCIPLKRNISINGTVIPMKVLKIIPSTLANDDRSAIYSNVSFSSAGSRSLSGTSSCSAKKLSLLGEPSRASNLHSFPAKSFGTSITNAQSQSACLNTSSTKSRESLPTLNTDKLHTSDRMPLKRNISINGKVIPMTLLKMIPSTHANDDRSGNNNISFSNAGVRSLSPTSSCSAPKMKLGEPSRGSNLHSLGARSTCTSIINAQSNSAWNTRATESIPTLNTAQFQSGSNNNTSSSNAGASSFYGNKVMNSSCSVTHSKVNESSRRVLLRSFSTTSAGFTVTSTAQSRSTAKSASKSVPVKSNASFPTHNTDAGDHHDVRAELKDVKEKLNEMCNYMKRGRDGAKHFIFPVRSVASVNLMDKKIILQRKDLVSLLKKKIRHKKENVLGSLLAMIFTTDVMYLYNVTGKDKLSFKKLRLYEVLKEVTNLKDNETLYKYLLTKAIHNMHVAHYRKLKKHEREALKKQEREAYVDNEGDDSA